MGCVCENRWCFDTLSTNGFHKRTNRGIKDNRPVLPPEQSNQMKPTPTFAVLDFETTGLSPNQGARPTEIAVVLVQGGVIVDRYQSLMNAGVPVPWDIQQLTGISNEMVRRAPGVAVVMREAAEFVGLHPLVAHNAAFDSKFWRHELDRLQKPCQQEFVCSMLLSRRLFPHANNHRLGTLVQMLGLPKTGNFHRALADAEATAHLLLRIQQELRSHYGVAESGDALLRLLQKAKTSQVEAVIRRQTVGMDRRPG
jgi:DNA polymerase-3 subunit epsilon